MFGTGDNGEKADAAPSSMLIREQWTHPVMSVQSASDKFHRTGDVVATTLTAQSSQESEIIDTMKDNGNCKVALVRVLTTDDNADEYESVRKSNVKVAGNTVVQRVAVKLTGSDPETPSGGQGNGEMFVRHGKSWDVQQMLYDSVCGNADPDVV